MSNILEHARASRAFEDCKSALREVGCDVCDVDNIDDVATTIRKQCVTGPNAVINASLMSGPGIKIVPVDRKGYKISANDEAVLTSDINDDMTKGMSIHKSLWIIANQLLPKAFKQAAAAPAIVDIELVKSSYDGIDYYDNKAFGREGSGTKTGLHPNEWYLKVTTFSQREPLYMCCSPLIADIRKSFLHEARHMCGCMINEAIKKHEHSAYHQIQDVVPPCHPHHPHHPHKPTNKPDESFGGFDDDPGFTYPDTPVPPVDDDPECPPCNEDETPGGTPVVPGPDVPNTSENVWEVEDEDGNVVGTVPGDSQNTWEVEDEDGNVVDTVPGDPQPQSLEDFIDELKA